MTKLADLMEQNKELLATIDAWDNGRCEAMKIATIRIKADTVPNHRQDLL